jgi:hypothetical protein
MSPYRCSSKVRSKSWSKTSIYLIATLTFAWLNAAWQNATSSPLIIDTNITETGDVTRSSSSSAAAGDNLNIVGVAVISTAGNITLSAADDFNSTMLSTVAAAGNITISVGVEGLGIADGDTGDATLAGDYDAGGIFNISGDNGDNTFDLNPLGANLDIDAVLGLEIYGGGGADLFRITPSDTTVINIFGGTDSDVLDYFGPGFVTYTDSSSGIITAAGFSDVNFSNIETLNIVPIPAAAWLFGSGLIGLIGIARRKKTV